MEKLERGLQVWLTLWGIFIALFIQVIYEAINNSSLKISIGLSIASLGLAILAVVSVRYFSNNKGVQSGRTLSTPQPDEKKEWKISIKNGDKMLEATGMDGDTVKKIFESWHENINPANPDEMRIRNAKT